MEAGVRTERFDPAGHDVSAFSCGEPTLDRWLRDQAGSVAGQPGTTVRVAAHGDRLIACYRLSAFQIEAQHVPGGGPVVRSPVPAILISCLGVDRPCQHRGVGAALLWNAFRFADSAALPLGVRVIVAYAPTERASGFCSRHGFRPFQSDPRRLYVLAQDITSARP